MARYIGTRLVWALVTVLAIVVVNFVLTHAMPGDPVTALVGEFPVPDAYVKELRVQLGLDDSLAKQLGLYLLHLMQGDFGYSFANRMPVLPLILERARATLLLMLPALTMAAVAGTWLAVRTVRSTSRTANAALTALSLSGTSIPVFWLAQLLVMLFAVKLSWLPAQGMLTSRGQGANYSYALDVLSHFVLPAFCITLSYLAVVARVGRASMAEVTDQDFVLTARAKGLSEGVVFRRHILRNALIPVVTVIGYNFGYSVTGAILTETVFAWPGVGGLFISSVSARDYPVLSGIFVLASIAVVLANLVTDLVYALVDPRIRGAPRKGSPL